MDTSIVARGTAASHRRLGRTPGAVARHLVLLFFAVVCLFPFIDGVISSLKNSSEILQVPPDFWPRSPTLASYQTVLSTLNFGHFLFNSLLVALVATGAMLATSAAAGYVFAKYRFFGREQLFIVLLSTMMIPFPAILVPLFLQLASLGWIDTYQGLIVPTGIVSTFGIFLMRQAIASIPTELIEAARIDGASELRVFFRLIVPLVSSTLAVLAILHFFFMWDSFLWPLAVVNDTSMRTLPLALTALNSEHGPRYDLQTAAAVLTNIPVLLVFLIAQRQLIRGVALTGAKM
jgi:ABC-type glycerol-3-phosphate transport system permease component